MTDGTALKRSTWQWNARKEKAALLLAEGKTWAAIEQELGVSSSTLNAWSKEPAFQDRVDAHHEVIIRDARRILRRNATQAAQKVVDIAFNGSNLHATRLAAAKDVLDRVGLKAPEKLEHTGRDGADLPPLIQINAIDYRALAASLAPRPVLDCAAPGEGEGVGDGPALGQEHNGRGD